MRIVITGASGNVGVALLRRLHAEGGHEIVGLTRRPPPTDTEPYSAARWHHIDLADPSVAALMTGLVHDADAVVHLAWAIQPGRDRELLRRTNQHGTQAVVEAVAAAGVPQLVHMSSIGAYSRAEPPHRVVDESYPTGGVPTSSYSVDKSAAERVVDELADASDQVVTTVRPGLILQPDAAAEIARYFIGRLLPTSLLRPSVLRFAPWPKAIAIQIVHADDVADALVRILHRRAAGPLNLAAEPVLDRSTLRDVFGGLGPSVPLPLARAAVAASWQLHLQPTDTGWIDLAQSVPILDTGRAKRDLDWTPFHRADDLLGDFLAALRIRHGTGGPLLHSGR
jgi:nucleoside-diphosphate-sugar epimerase